MSIALLATVGLLAGCVPVLVGGAIAGGYYLGKDKREPAQIAEDGSITARIKAKLIGDKYVDAFEINVDTYDGVVTLRGDVNNTIARDQAAKLAGEVNGVKSVDNQIRVLKPVKKSDG
jgi:osmotically-inducible protein OsmY